jgi:hypothetical protein
MSAVWRSRADLPDMLGPVMRMICTVFVVEVHVVGDVGFAHGQLRFDHRVPPVADVDARANRRVRAFVVAFCTATLANESRQSSRAIRWALCCTWADVSCPFHPPVRGRYVLPVPAFFPRRPVFCFQFFEFGVINRSPLAMVCLRIQSAAPGLSICWSLRGNSRTRC